MPEGPQQRLEPTLACQLCPLLPSCDEGATNLGCGNEIPEDAQYLHAGSSDLTVRLAEVGGLDIRIRSAYRPSLPPDLPTYIPRVQWRSGFISPRWAALAIPVDRAIVSGNVRTSREIRALLGIGDMTKLVLSTHQRDDVLENIWDNRSQFVESLSRANYDLVLVPSFSLWDYLPPLEHRYQIARGLRFLELLLRAGVMTVPHISWFRKRDIRAWGRELRRWGQPKAFSIDLQTLQTEEKWRWGAHGFKLLADEIGPGWEVIVNGVGARYNIESLLGIFGHIHLINERAYQVAMSGFVVDETLIKERRAGHLSAMQRFDRNVGLWAEAARPSSSCLLTRSARRLRLLRVASTG